jgi:hypothetical protein
MIIKDVLIVLCFCMLSACTASPYQIHVATDGSDHHPGTFEQPIQTLHQAQARVREFRRHRPDRSVSIVIHPGTYELWRPLQLTPEDSGSADAPVTWRARHPNRKPILSAGLTIQGKWRPSEKPGIWFIDCPLARHDAADGGWNFRQLFVNGKRAARARYPNASDNNPFLYANENNKAAKDHIAIDPSLIKEAWLGETDVQINLVVDWLFFNQWNTIASIDKQAGKLFFTEQERHGRVYKNNWFYIEGIFAELDEPGEWYLDRELGRLYYMPEQGEDPNELSFVAPYLDRLIHAKGDIDAGTYVQHVHFENLDFRNTSFTLGHIAPRVHTDAAVRFENTLHSSVRDCHFQNIGGYAHWLHLDCRHNRFDRNTVLDSGGGGVLLTGARLSYMDDAKVYTPGQAASNVAPIFNEITRNTVRQCGQIRYYGGGVHLDSRPSSMAMLPGNYIAHNHFEDLSRNGIFAFRNQGGNIIEYNHIHDAMQTTIDGACIHLATMNYLCSPNHVLNNWLYDIWGFRYLPDQKPRRVLANGVFLDWDTSNAVVKQNYVYNAGGEAIKAVWNNLNNTIEDNFISEKRVAPPFADELGPKGNATHGLRLEDNRLIGRVIHYSESAFTRRKGTWEQMQLGGQGKLFSYHVLKAAPDKPARIEYDLPISSAGTYKVYVLYKPDDANASNAKIQVHHAEGMDNIAWDMQKGHKHGFAIEVGEYPFKMGRPAKVVITNEDANGLVVADSVAFVLQPGNS